MSKKTVGSLLGEARSAHRLSLQEVAERAGCSPGYVHKLEADLVRTPSPRVLAGLARSLGLRYGDLMTAAGYDAPTSGDGGPPGVPTGARRYSNAHIVELLEQLQREVVELRSLVEAKR